MLRLQLVYGEGIQNYMNDSPVDVGIENNAGNTVTPILGETLPILGTVIFLDHQWNDKWSSTVGYSYQDINNTDGPGARRLPRRALRARQPALQPGRRT